MQNETKYDLMLLSLRQIIRSQQENLKPSSKQYFFDEKGQHKNIQSIIEESSKIINDKKAKKQQNLMTKSKILAAKQLLKEQVPNFVQNYIKEKIDSNLFSVEPNLFISKDDLDRFEEQKQSLIRQREQQVKNQKQRRALLIRSVKQFDQDKNSRVFVHEINSLIYQQQPNSSYLFKTTPRSLGSKQKISSKSNEIQNSNLFISQVYQQQQEEIKVSKVQKLEEMKKKQKQNKKNRKDSEEFDQQYKQFYDGVEQQKGYNYNQNNQMQEPKKQIQIQSNIDKYPKFIQAFKCFLLQQMKLVAVSNSVTLDSKKLEQRRSSNRLNKNQGQSFLWRNKPKKYINNPQRKKKNQQSIGNIVQKFRFKAFSINNKSQQAFMPSDKQIIAQKRVNKMVGQSKNFHLKSCVLTKNQLIYYDQNTNKKKEMKKVEFNLQRIQVQNGSKQEGSLFSKKEQNIKIVNVKGKNRSIKFEKGFIQGQAFYHELLKLMGNKVYSIISKMSNQSILYLQNFINNLKCQNFNISGNIFQFLLNQKSLKQREMYLNIICDLIALRNNIENIFLVRSRFNSNQMNLIFERCSILTNLKKIDLSYTRMIKQTFSDFCKFINQSKSSSKLDVILSNCKLIDETFSSNVGLFNSLCSKVKYLNLSNNDISVKTLQILKNCLENINSQIKHLILSDCPIRQFGKLSALIKDSRKLQFLEAQNCGFALDKRPISDMETFFQCFKKQGGLKYLKLGNNGQLSDEAIKILQKFWINETLKFIEVDINFKNFKLTKTLSMELNTSVQLNFELQRK